MTKSLEVNDGAAIWELDAFTFSGLVHVGTVSTAAGSLHKFDRIVVNDEEQKFVADRHVFHFTLGVKSNRGERHAASEVMLNFAGVCHRTKILEECDCARWIRVIDKGGPQAGNGVEKTGWSFEVIFREFASVHNIRGCCDPQIIFLVLATPQLL